jgi:hypothetical protein
MQYRLRRPVGQEETAGPGLPLVQRGASEVCPLWHTLVSPWVVALCFFGVRLFEIVAYFRAVRFFYSSLRMVPGNGWRGEGFLFEQSAADSAVRVSGAKLI